MKKFFLTTLLLLAGVSISLAQTAEVKKQEISVLLGNVKIIIPAPDGFEDVSSIKSVQERIISRTDTGNDLLAAFLPKETMDALRNQNSDIKNLFNSADVQILKKAREKNLSASDFVGILKYLQSSGLGKFDLKNPILKERIENVEKNITEQNKGNAALDISKTESLGEFRHTDNVFSQLVLMKMSFQTGNISKDAIVIGGVSLIRVKQRLLYVYIYREFKSKDDIEQLKNLSNKWTSEIIAANQ